MRQVFLSGKGQISVMDAPVPSRIKGGVLVRTAFSLISTGTEGAAVTKNEGLRGLAEKVAGSRDRIDQVWEMVKSQGLSATAALVGNKLNDHTPLGYSLSGSIEEVDDENLGFRPGDRVACMGTGLANHAQFASVPKNLVAKVPDTVTYEEASFGALACIAMQGIRRLELEPGESVAILGLGLIGQLALRLASCMGYRAYGFDIDQGRVSHAQRHASDAVVSNSGEADPVAVAQAATLGEGFDGLVICAAAKSDMVVNQAFDMCRKRGRVSVVGDIGLGLERAKMYAKELELRLSCSYGIGRYDADYELRGIDYPLAHVRWTERRNLDYFLSLLSSGKLDISDLVSATYPVDQASDAYAAVKTGRSDVFGVLLDYRLSGTEEAAADERLVRYHERGTAKDALSIGLIGVGAYAKNVHIPNLQKIPSVAIEGVASSGGASAAVAAKKIGAGFATSDSDRLLAVRSIDAVVISTRHASHAQLVCDALKAGKHVFVEKPMATTTKACLEILDAQAASGKVVRVGFNRRFAPMLRTIKDFVPGKKIFTARVNTGDLGTHWSNAGEEGGRLLGEGVHFFDLANWMMNSTPTHVSAQFLGDADPLNANASVSLRYPDGSLALIVYNTIGSPSAGKEYFEVFGDSRVAKVDDYQSLWTSRRPKRSGSPRKGDKGQFGAMSEFISAVRTGECAGGADARSGLWATAIFEAAVQSGRSGREIDLRLFIKQIEEES